jgi:hypothetical protein
MAKQIARLVSFRPGRLEEYLNNFFSVGYRLISITRCSENDYLIVLEVDE